MPNKARKPQVLSTSATLKPTAQCCGVLRHRGPGQQPEVTTPCDAGWKPTAYSLPGDTAVK